MIYQFFLLSEGKKLVEWNKEGFPGNKRFEEDEVVGEDTIFQLAQKAPASGKKKFASINFSKLTVSYLFEGKDAYAIVSDRADSLKARKGFLEEIREELLPHLKELRKRGEPAEFDELVERKVRAHTRPVAGPRSSTGGSTLLGILGGSIFLSLFFWIGRLIPPNPPNDTPFVWFINTQFAPIIGSFPFLIFFVIVAVVTGLVTGFIGGRGVGGALGGLISFVVMFIPPTTSYLPLDALLTEIESKLAFLGVTTTWQAGLLFGISYGILAAIVGGLFGAYLNGRTLVADRIPNIEKRKKTKKPRERTEELGAEEGLEGVESEITELEGEKETIEVDEKDLEELSDLLFEEESEDRDEDVI